MIKDGLSKSAIARKLGLSRETISKYSKLPEGHMPVIKREAANTTVDAYLPHIARMLEEAHKLEIHIPSSSIYKEIQKMGYTGSLRWMAPQVHFLPSVRAQISCNDMNCAAK